jgi:hypothetical protein
MNAQEKFKQKRQALQEQIKHKQEHKEVKEALEKEIKITLIVRQISLLEQILELLKNYFHPSKKFEITKVEEREQEHQEVKDALEEVEETKKSEIFEDLILDSDVINDL